MIDRRPALIARCAGTADVIAAVGFARETALPVAVRGGGHSAPGYATCDDGIVIDLSAMSAIGVDPEARTARAEAGATWGEFDAETQELGLAVTGGRFSTTGIAGLTLGSGSGWLERKCGLTATTCSPPTSSRRRAAGHGERGREPRALLGPPRRQRQLRDRHVVRAPAPRGRPDDLRRDAGGAARPRRRDRALHARLHGRRARRPGRRRRVRQRAAGAVRPGGDALQAGRRDRSAGPATRGGRARRRADPRGRAAGDGHGRADAVHGAAGHARRRRAEGHPRLHEGGVHDELGDEAIDKLVEHGAAGPAPWPSC